MSELVQIKGHDQTSDSIEFWAEKAKGKKLMLIDLANCEDMTIWKAHCGFAKESTHDRPGPVWRRVIVTRAM